MDWASWSGKVRLGCSEMCGKCPRLAGYGRGLSNDLISILALLWAVIGDEKLLLLKKM